MADDRTFRLAVMWLQVELVEGLSYRSEIDLGKGRRKMRLSLKLKLEPTDIKSALTTLPELHTDAKTTKPEHEIIILHNGT